MENFRVMSTTTTTASLAWDVPTELIDTYVVVTTDSNGNTISTVPNIPRTTSSLEVSNLQPCETYTFKIYMTKGNSQGPERTVTGETGNGLQLNL